MLAIWTYFLVFYFGVQVIYVGSIKCYHCYSCATVDNGTSKGNGKMCGTNLVKEKDGVIRRERFAARDTCPIIIHGSNTKTVCCDTELCNGLSAIETLGRTCYNCPFQDRCPVVSQSTPTETECGACEIIYTLHEYGERTPVNAVSRQYVSFCHQPEEVLHDNTTGLILSVKTCCNSDKCNWHFGCYNCTNCRQFSASLPYAWECASCATFISKSGVVDRSCVKDQCQSKTMGDGVLKCCSGNRCNNEDGLSYKEERQKVQKGMNEASERTVPIFLCSALPAISAILYISAIYDFSILTIHKQSRKFPTGCT